MKITRIDSSCYLTGLPEQNVTLDLAEPVEVHPPVQMVDLVLHAGCPEPGEFTFFYFATGVEEPHSDGAGPFDPGRYAGQVGACLLMRAQCDTGVQDLRVGHAHGLTARFAGIDHCKAAQLADLRCCQPHARHRLHSVDHIPPDPENGIADGVHCHSPASQATVRPGNAAAHCH